MKKLGKSGKMGAGAKVTISLIAVAVVVLLLAQFGVFQNIGGGSSPVLGCPDSTTTLTYPAKNTYSLSSSVTATAYGRVNGGDLVNLSTITSMPVGAKITDIFYSASNYIDAKADDFTVDCGQALADSVRMKPTDNPTTFLIKDDAGTTMTDGTSGASNLSSTAGTLEMTLRIGSSTDKTTGDLVIVVEYDNDTQADTISMTGATEVAIPEVYSEEATASLVKAFKVPEVEDGATRSHTVKIEPKSAQTLGEVASAIRFTRYSEQAFEDVDGSVAVGVEDSDGTAKHEDTGDYDVSVD